MPSIHVAPKFSYFDEPISIRVTGLHPGQNVVFNLSMLHENGNFESFAEFVADADGNVDLQSAVPIRGSYAEAEPMGLFYGLVPAADKRSGSGAQHDVRHAVVYRLTIKNNRGETLDDVTIRRPFLYPNIERRDIDEAGIIGTLFVPRGVGPFPAIIDMYGGAGGIKEHRSALLAARGFAVLCLPYFGYKTLPKSVLDVDMSYFKAAIDWLAGLAITTDRVGIVSTCLGSAIALLSAVRWHKVCAVVSINCMPILTQWNVITENGKPLPHVVENVLEQLTPGTILTYAPHMELLQMDDKTLIPIERSAEDAQFYFIAGTDDENICSVKATKIYADRLRRFGRTVTVDIIEDAGHLFDPPYLPLMEMVYMKSFDMNIRFGGKAYPHCKAQVIEWEKIVDFLATNVGRPKTPCANVFPQSHL